MDIHLAHAHNIGPTTGRKDKGGKDRGRQSRRAAGKAAAPMEPAVAAAAVIQAASTGLQTGARSHDARAGTTKRRTSRE